jgi:hypothetical protein
LRSTRETELVFRIHFFGIRVGLRHDLASRIRVCWTRGVVGAPELAPSALEETGGVGGIMADLTERRDSVARLESAARAYRLDLTQRETH